MVGETRRGTAAAEVSLDTVEDPSNSVRVELDGTADVDSVVLAYRRDGELHELAERAAPAVAEIEGDLLHE